MTFTITRAKLFGAIAALVLIIPSTAYAAHIFGDVEDGRFYAEATEWALDNGITVGCGGGGNFCPDDGVTRGENITFAWRYDDLIVQPALTALETADDATEAAAAAAQATADANAAAIAAPEEVELRFGSGSFTSASDITFTTACATSVDGIMRAGLPLPVGATITGFGGQFTGTGSDLDLVRADAVTGSIATLTTATSSFGIEEMTLETPEVVDGNEFFFLEWTDDGVGTDRICGGLVHYTTGG
ncbi:MAG: hypothetical protein ACI9C1_001794 [Candidatus Aldehydirespiratoraceae bacterium]|jgi:hypothetical protein